MSSPAKSPASASVGGRCRAWSWCLLRQWSVVLRPEWVRRREAREYRSCTGTEPIAVLPSEDGDHLRSVLPGGDGLGGAHRAVDAARGPRAPVRQHALQRPPPRGPADVTGAAVQAAQDARAGGRGRPRRRRVPPHPGRQGAVAGHRVDGHLGPALGARRRDRQALRRLAADVGHPPQRRHRRPCPSGGWSCTSTCRDRATRRATSGWCWTRPRSTCA